MINRNTEIYYTILADLIRFSDYTNVPGIKSELLSKLIEFSPVGIIHGSSEKYIAAEKDWYESMDLCIKNHPIIENNPIWKNCATDDGYVNSNYGWCVHSKDNFYQFEEARKSLIDDKYSRRAVIVYTRPSIHIEQNDGIHAHQDMMCTCYTIFFIRNNELIMHVHMRSNDVWYGLRYDLVWQQEVYNNMYNKLLLRYPELIKGSILWIADSLHLYERNYEDAIKWIAEIDKIMEEK